MIRGRGPTGGRIGLLFHTLRHTRTRQLISRLGLSARRKASVAAARWGIGPGGWYRAPPPPLREEGALGALLPPREQAAELPVAVDLAGTPWVIQAGTEWHPRALERGTRLEKLTLHYMEYLRGLTPRAAAGVVLDWIAGNPPFREGYWKDAWNSYALSIRVVVWIDLLEAPWPDRDRSGAGPDRGTPMGHLLDPLRRERVDQSIAAQLRFLDRNVESDIGGNHLIRNIRALLRGGWYFRGLEAERWLQKGLALLRDELPEQILPDGMHFERSPAYHLQVLADLVDARRVVSALADRESADGRSARPLLTELDAALSRMVRVGEELTHPDGGISLFADGGLHMTQPPAVILGAARVPLRTVADAGDGARAGSRLWSLPDAGYFGLRSGRDLLVVDCGPVGPDHLPAHGHGDALSFEWTVEGVRIVVDAGVAEYHPGPLREYSRSTRAHNTVTLDDLDQSEFWSAFRVGRRARACVEAWGRGATGTQSDPSVPAEPGSTFRLTGFHDGYRRLPGRPVHRRSITAERDRVQVMDAVVGGRGQKVVSRLLLGPSVRATPVREGVLFEVDEAGVSLRIRLTTDAAVTVEPGLWMPDFGVRVEVHRVVLEYGRAPASASYLIEVEKRGGGFGDHVEPRARAERDDRDAPAPGGPARAFGAEG